MSTARIEGKNEGIKEKEVTTILNGYNKGYSIEVIADITGVSIGEVKSIISKHSG